MLKIFLFYQLEYLHHNYSIQCLKPVSFLKWHNASCQCDNMPLWVLAICHKAVLFAKGEILSLCVSLYIFMLKSREPFTYSYAKLMLGSFEVWGCKMMFFNVEGTNISKCHVFEIILDMDLVSVNPPDLIASVIWHTDSDAHPLINLHLQNPWLLLSQILINVEMFALSNASNIFKHLSKI